MLVLEKWRNTGNLTDNIGTESVVGKSDTISKVFDET
jgi:hypothetical protein